MRKPPVDPADCPHLRRLVVHRYDPQTKEDQGKATVCERCKAVLGWLDPQ